MYNLAALCAKDLYVLFNGPLCMVMGLGFRLQYTPEPSVT